MYIRKILDLLSLNGDIRQYFGMQLTKLPLSLLKLIHRGLK